MTDLSLTPEVTGDFGLPLERMRADKRLREKRSLCAAAVMGHTNMGQPAPTKDKVQDWMRMDTDRWPWNLNNYVEAVSGHLFESDEHQEIFLGEAESWLKTCAEEPFLKSWPEKAALFE